MTSFTRDQHGDQTVSMQYDDPDSGVSLDRSNYPQNTGVVITIDDQALNVDPTSEDTWTFVTITETVLRRLTT